MGASKQTCLNSSVLTAVPLVDLVFGWHALLDPMPARVWSVCAHLGMPLPCAVLMLCPALPFTTSCFLSAHAWPLPAAVQSGKGGLDVVGWGMGGAVGRREE